MRDRLHWTALILGCAAFLAILIQVPQFLHVIDPRFQGIFVPLNSDESVYLARVQEALIGRPELAAEAFIGDPAIKGTQLAMLETWYGTLFRWTGFRAATVLQIMDSVNVFFLFILLWMYLRLCGFTRRHALIGAVLFSSIELYNLNRPVHLAGSTLLTLAALSGILLGMRFHRGLGIAGGILLGTLVGVYVWSWMWGWGFYGMALLVAGCWLLREKNSVSVDTFVRLLIFGLVAVLFALPHVWHLWTLSHDPLYAEAVFRSGMHPGRAPESWPYSILFTTMLGSVLIAYIRDPQGLRRYEGVLATIATAWIVIHQQVFHGIVFNYVSHELLLLVISALSVVLLAWVYRTRLLFLGAGAAIIYLVAVAYDGRFVWKQYHPSEGRFEQQHLASALPALDALPQSTVLSSSKGSAFIAGFTHMDIVYSIYLKNLLMSHEEIAQRYCMTVLPLPPEQRHIRDHQHLVYPDAVAAFHDDPTVREREVAMVEKVCAEFDSDPVAALRKFHISYIFWDMRSDSEWDLSRLHVKLEKISEGDGWSLWQVPR